MIKILWPKEEKNQEESFLDFTGTFEIFYNSLVLLFIVKLRLYFLSLRKKAQKL